MADGLTSSPIESDFLAHRQKLESNKNDAWVQSQLVDQPPAKGAPVPPPTPQQQVDALPSSAFTGAGGDTVTDVTKQASPMGLFGVPLLPKDKQAKGSLTEMAIGPGFMSGIEKEAADTLQSIPNIALISGAGAFGAIPAIASVGGSRLLSLFFGVQMGKQLWEKNKEYQQSLKDEGGMGPKSRELLGRMTVLAAFTITAGKHAATEGTTATATPKPADAAATPAKGPSTSSLMSGIDPIEAAKRAKEELRVNLNYINAEDSTKKVIADINQMNSERLAADRQTKPHGATIAEAKMTIPQALAMEEGAPLRAGDIVALRDLRDVAATHVDNLAKATLAGDADAALQLKSAVSLAGELELRREMASRTVARSLEAHRIPSDAKRPALAPGDIAELSRTFSNTVDIDPLTLAQRLQALPRAEQKTTFLRQIVDGVKTGRDMVFEAWINSMLSGPQTHAVKVGSDLMATMWSVPERAIAAQYRSVGRMFGAGRGVEQGEAMAMLRGPVDGWQDGLRMAHEIWSEKKTGSGGVFDTGRQPSITAENAGVGVDTQLGKAIDLMGRVIRSPSRAMSSETAMFQAVNYRMELKAQALRQASAEGLQGDALSARALDIEANPPSFIKDAADKASLLNTYQSELGPLGASLTKTVNLVPGGRILLPFLRVPMNLAKSAGQRIPILAQLSPKNWSDIAAGGARSDLAMARMTSGALTAGVVASLVAAGRITSHGPRNPEVNKIWRETTGKQPDSIKIGNDWVSYSRIDPVGMMLGTIADSAEIMGQLPEDKAAELAMANVLAISESFINKTYMESLSSALDAIHDPSKGIKSLPQSLVRTLVPSLVRTIERKVDPPKRQVDSLLDAIIEQVPGWSSSLPMQRNLFGDPVLYPPGLGPDIISPFYSTADKHDLVADELVKQNAAISMPSKIFAGKPPQSLQMQAPSAGEGIPLTPQEYDLFVRLAGNELKGANGLGMKDTLAQLIQSDQYKNLSDGPDGSKVMAMKQIVYGFREAAKGELVNRSPKLKIAWEQQQVRKAVALRPPTGGLIGITGVQ